PGRQRARRDRRGEIRHEGGRGLLLSRRRDARLHRHERPRPSPGGLCSAVSRKTRLKDQPEPWLPLRGIRVAAFSMFVLGPFASAMLADLGAEVVKVEMPGGDPGRGYVPVQFETENRNKRGLALDLKNPAAKEIVHRLVRNADIVVEGFRPGVAKRLAIDYETLKKSKSNLVYCSISGYGQTGPWRERPGHDVNYVAAAGALAFPRQWLKPPARSSLPIADMGGGAFAAGAILPPLDAGQGARLALSLFETAFFWAAMRHGLDPEVDPRAHIFPVNDVFETQDGKRLTLGILEEHFWKNFVELAPELGEERFSTDALRRKNGDALSLKLEEAIKTRTASDWLRQCDENDGGGGASPAARRAAGDRARLRQVPGAGERPARRRHPAAHAEARRAFARDPGRARLRRRRDRRLPESPRGELLMADRRNLVWPIVLGIAGLLGKR